MNQSFLVNRTARFVVLFCTSLSFVLVRAALALPLDTHSSLQSSPQIARRIAARYHQSPLSFEINRGQTAKQVRFLSRGHGYNLFLTPREAVLSLRKAASDDLTSTARRYYGADADRLIIGPRAVSTSSVLRMKLLGANAQPHIEGKEQLAGKSNYLIGSDKTKWRTNVRHFGKVLYSDVYPGIDMVYYGNHRQLEYDFIVAPGADPTCIRLGFDNVKRMEIAGNGDLVLTVGGSRIVQKAPIIYQRINGRQRRIEGRYKMRLSRTRQSGDAAEAHEVSFEIGRYNSRLPLIIDPILYYSTYFGGGGSDAGLAIAVDALSNAYVVGQSTSAGMATVGALQPSVQVGDAIVAKFNALGQLIYSTYLGGNSYDSARDVTLDSSGNIYVMGTTESTNFPTSNAIQPSYAGADSFTGDTFVAKLAPSGTSLLYSTYLGGSGGDRGYKMAVDRAASVYILGGTSSTDFPVHNALRPTWNGTIVDGIQQQAYFVTKLNAAGSAFVYSTYLPDQPGGGHGTFPAGGVAVDSAGNAYVAGRTTFASVPVTSDALKPNLSGQDAFLLKLNSSGSTYLYATYFGGSNGDSAEDITIDGNGDVYVTGQTNSDDLPTTPNSAQPSRAGVANSYVVKFHGSDNSIAYCTYLDGTVHGIAVDTLGRAYITGETRDSEFPQVNGLQAFNQNKNQIYDDAFVTKLDSTGSSIVYSTYLGGSHIDVGAAIAVDLLGSAYVTGYTIPVVLDFPIYNPTNLAPNAARRVMSTP